MRRGQDFRPTTDPSSGFSKAELLEASGLSSKTFDLIRKAARIRGPGHGGLDWMFTISDVTALILRAESGNFSERGGPAAEAWRGLLAERGVKLPPPRKLR